MFILRSKVATLSVAFICCVAARYAPASELEVCDEFLASHIEDPEWQSRCLAELEALPTRPPTSTAKPPLPKIFPLSQTKISIGPDDGDSEAIAATLRKGESLTISVVFDASALRDELSMQAFHAGQRALNSEQLREKRSGYSVIKQRANLLEIEGVEEIRDFKNLPMSAVLLSSESALDTILRRAEVITAYFPRELEAFLVESLPLINRIRPANRIADAPAASE